MKYSKNTWLLIWYSYKFKKIKKNFFFFLFYERKTTIPYIFNLPLSIYVHNGLQKKRYLKNKYRIGQKLGSYIKTRNLHR